MDPAAGMAAGQLRRKQLRVERFGGRDSCRRAKATATGSRATLYGSIFYHFDKITEVYFAADYLKLKDGYKVGATNGFANQSEFALGLRTRF